MEDLIAFKGIERDLKSSWDKFTNHLERKIKDQEDLYEIEVMKPIGIVKQPSFGMHQAERPLLKDQERSMVASKGDIKNESNQKVTLVFYIAL